MLLAALVARPYDPAPLAFERNEGQLAADVAYAARGADFNLLLTNDGVVLGLGGPAFVAGTSTSTGIEQELSGPSAPRTDGTTTELLVHMSWLSGREAAAIEGVNQLPGVTNNVRGDDPSAWRTGIASFERVRYDEVYDGIDLEFYGRAGDVEFDWIVAPSADPSQITMLYAGMDNISLDAGGNLVIAAGSQQLVQHAPVVYQVIAGQQREVASSYRLGEGGTVQFALGTYDPSVPLVIDPVLGYSTYLGGSSNETAADVATDAQGNTFVIGTTGSTTIAGRNAGPGAFVTKFKPDGQIAYVTTLGPTPRNDINGFAQSVAEAVAIGPDGLPYAVFLSIEGEYVTYSSTHQLHISKLDAEGVPVSDTVVPVPDDVSPTAPFGHLPPYFLAAGGFAVDDVGGAYVTYEMIRPIKTAEGGAGFPETEYRIAKVTASGIVEFTKPLSTLPRAIAVDAQHNIYLTATTNLEGLQVSPNAFQPQRKDNPNTSDFDLDVYVAMYDPTATGFLAGTYLGGTYIDFAGGIAVNPNQPGVVYLAGATQSPDFPLKNPYQPRLNNSAAAAQGVYDGFITALDLVKMKLLASTFLGGSIDRQNPSYGGNGQDVLSDIALDAAGQVYVVGETNSLDFPVASPLLSAYTPGPTLTGTVSGSTHVPPFYDFVIAKFDASLSALEFSTYFGGSGQDSTAYQLDPFFSGTWSGPRLAVDAAGTMHVAGTSKGDAKEFTSGHVTATDDFPMLNAAQPNFAGGYTSDFFWDGAGASDAVVLAIAQRGVVTGRSIRTTQGRQVTGIVADFTSGRSNASTGDFEARIDWADGSATSLGRVTRDDPASTRFHVVGTHQYDKPGAYPVLVTVTDLKTGFSPVTNINVSHLRDKQYEPTIAVDPANPQRLFSAAVDQPSANAVATGGGGLFVSVSTDGGVKWSPRIMADGKDGLPKAQGDPKAVFDQFGNLFLTYLGADRNNIVVVMSKDGGRTFDPTTVTSLVAAGSAPGLGPLRADQPSIAVGPGTLPDTGSVWVTFADLQNNVVVAAGALITGPGTFDPFGPQQVIPGSGAGNFGDVKVGPNGEVLVVWEDSGTGALDNGRRVGPFKVYTSLDRDGVGTLPFDSPKLMLTLADPSRTNPIPALPDLAIGAEVNLAWDLRTDRVYAAYSELKPGSNNRNDADIFVVSSQDSGANWSLPVRVNDDTGESSQFLPSITLDPGTGNVAVGWYDTRLDGNNVKAAYYTAISGDGGRTFSPNLRVSLGTSDATDPRLASTPGAAKGYGDYSSIVYLNGVLYPAWADNSDLIKDSNRGLNSSQKDVLQFEVATSVVGVIDVSVARAAIQPLPITAVAGQLFDSLVAVFQHPDPTMQPANFKATIHWGDDALSVSDGTIRQPGGPGSDFLVDGKHTFAAAGAYPLWVDVRDLLHGLDAVPVSNITAQQGSQAEATIAIDPTDVNRVFAAGVEATRRGLPARGLPVSVSNDGGVTWSTRVIADGNDAFPLACCDPRAVFDQFGNLFLTYNTLGDTADQEIVLLSIDGGRNFTLLYTSPDLSVDQPSIAVGPAHLAGHGSVWLTWEQGGGIRVAGAIVSGLGVVGPFSETLYVPESTDGLFRNFGDIAVGPDGQVLVSYVVDPINSSNKITVRVDPDGLGPQTFVPAVPVTGTNVPTKTAIPAQNTERGIENKAVLAWDRSDGPHRGRVYLVYTDADTLPDTNIFLRYSDVNGATWSEPIQVNDDGTTNSQFFPSIAVDQSSGNVAIGWHSGVGNNTETRFVATMSDDGGVTFRTAYLVSPGNSDSTDVSLDANGALFSYGDYTGLAFANGFLQPVFADNSIQLDAVPDPRQFEIANARIAVAEVSNAPLVVQTFDVNDREGTEFTRRIATFTDPSGGSAVGNYKATIDWGDGSPPTEAEILEEIDGGFSVSGTHEYKKFGQYPIHVTIKGPRTKGEGALNASIENAPLSLAFGDGEGDVRVVRETEFTKVLGTLTDLNHNSQASDFDATLDWGDGSFSDGIIKLTQGGGPGEPNTYSISGTHKYFLEQTFTVTVSIREKATGQKLDRSGSIVNGDPPLEVQPGLFLDIQALAGINTGDLVLVTFTVPDDVDVQLQTGLGEYIATINWGDGEVDANVIPFMTSEDVTVVGRHTYATAGEYFPSVTVQDDSNGVFSVPLIAMVEPDVTSQVRASGSGLTYDPVTDRFVGDLTITNTSTTDISGPLYVVIHGLPDGVSLDSFSDIDGAGNPLYKVDQSRLSAGASLPPITLEFSNPGHVPISYTVQVFDGIRPEPLGSASLVFEPNFGQASDAISFIARGQGYAIGLSAGSASLVLSGSATQAGAAALMEIVGASATLVGVALDPQPGVSNYFSDGLAITDVPHFGRVRYAEVYAGIDVEYYGRDGLLEYDWIVRPGADPDAIALRFRGVDGIVMDHAGNLRLQVHGGELVQRAPVAYQIVAGARVEVATAYQMRADGTIGFTIGAYDPSLALVIDPVLVYSTYLGGTGGESATAVAVDAAGNTYVTGETGSSDFFTVNPFDPELNQPETSPFWLSFDAFVAKFDPRGVLVYSTYLGGGSTVAGVIRETIGQSIAVDSAGHAWIGGSTKSLEFPTTTSAPSGFEPASSAGAGFLTKLSADGSSILYSALIRSNPFDLAVDDAGDVYATGFGFALKLDPATNSLLYLAPILGGALGLAIDGVGQAYVAGSTDSPAFPTKNALFPELHNRRFNEFGEEISSADGFVMKLSADGDVLFSTYLGGRFSDVAYDIAVDGSGVIHIVGQTESDDLPVPGGLDTSLGGTQDGFLIKLANDGSSLLYGTYIGGGGQDSLIGVGVDVLGRTYVGGTTGSLDLPTVRAHQPAFGGGPRFLDGSFIYPDGFAASIAADGGSFVYLTYLGGGGFDDLRGVAVDTAGNASYVGVTNSPDLLTRNAAQSRLLSIETDAFIIRLLAGDAGTIALHNSPFTAVEGNQYNGLVAFFDTNGSETADQFSAIIDWGDGVSSNGTIAGEFRTGFQILGNHLYSDVGAHDVFVTLRDSLGQTVTAMSTGAVAAAAEGRVGYHVAIDTAALAGTQGVLSFQFNPGAIPGSPDAEARITALNLFGGVAGGNMIDGDASQTSSSEFTLKPSAMLNRFIENVTLGARIEFDLELVGPGLSQPHLGNFADVFALQLLGANGVVPLLSADATASLLRVDLAPDGSTQAESSGTAVTVAASGVATVANGRVNLTLAPVTIQEGLEFNGPVATFTNGNPLESAGEFTATIDWGDGSPITAGVISGSNGNFTVSGAHVYQTVGSYALAVTVSEPDGLTVRSATGRSILAALLFNNDWGSSQFPSDSRPVSGDFNGDGILDVAVGGFLPIPTIPGRGVGILLGRGDGSFELAGFQTTSPSAIEIAVADFNNDGKLDVAAAIWNRAESVVELLLGNGDGTLQPAIPLAELRNPGSIAAADFNRDGNIDLAYTESYAPTQHTGSNTLRIALGNGNGTFRTPTSTAIIGGFNCHFSTADMDGDAVPDIMLASSSALEFLRGLGDGSFDTSVLVALGLYSQDVSSSFALGDFDGDGRQDVAAVDGVNLSIFSGRGDGTFAGPLQIAAPLSVAVVAGDFNGDGQSDLATAVPNNAGRVWVFINNGAGSFAGSVAYEGISFPSRILAEDFDRDGHIDIATSGNTAVISVLPGIGDGSFASAVRYATGLSEPQNLLAPQGVATNDVNGDSHTDAVLIMSDGRIVTELGHGDGTFQSIVSGNVGSRFSPLLADVNNDGRLDVIAPSLLSGIGIVLGSGDGRFPTRQVSNPTGATSAVVLADFNQDGRLDMAAVYTDFFSNRFVSVSLANADGTFQNAVSYATGVIFGGDRSIAVGDFNADSRPDLAVANNSGTLSVLLGNADGTFATAINTIVGNSSTHQGVLPESARVGDFNGDGKLDLVAVGFNGSGLVLPGNGDGTFGAPITFTTTILNGARDVAVGDFNGDGKLDIVIGTESHVNFFVPGGGLSVLLGNGDGTFQAEVAYFEGFWPTSVTLGDFNQDGRLDIAAGDSSGGNAKSGVVGILIGNPDGTFQTAVTYSITGVIPRSIAAGDLNGDGKLDLAVVNQSRDTGILLGNGNGTFGRSLNYFTSGDGNVTSATAVAIGDLNGDGRADLVTGNSLLLQDSDGTFPNRSLFTYLPPVINVDFQTSNPEDIAAGDLNADGNVDLAVSMRGTTVVLFGNGNGSFLPPILLSPPAATGLGSTSNRVALVDMDGDGDLDLVTLHQNLVQGGGAVAVWRNDGHGLFSTPLVRNVPMPTYDFFGTGLDMETGDLNGDSFVDVVVTDSGDDSVNGTTSGGASVMLGVGDGSLAQPAHYFLPPRQRAYRVTLADLNRDARPEIVALTSPFGFGTSRSAVAVFTNNGNGSFGPAQIYDHGQSSAVFLAAGDFNGDSAADIIVPDSSSFTSTFSIIFAGDAPVLVTDAPVSVTAMNLNPRAGLAFTAQVANFTDANPFGEAGDFTATINWGDGQTSTGSIRVNPLGGFEVIGAHNYASTGVFTTTVTVRENGEGTHVGSATARVSTTDPALTATGLVLNAIEDMPFTGVVATFTDADPNGSTGDFSANIDWGDGQISAGAIAALVGGGYTVIGTHTYANPGTLPVRVDINDIGGSTATANSTAQVAPHVNQAPVAINDSYATNEDTTLVMIAAQGVLANDTDADADPLTALLVTGPTRGSLTLSLDGSFSYIPDANFNGTDRFIYRANDGKADSNVATVNITVTSANDAPVANDDFASTIEDTPVVVDVVANDTDIDGHIDPTSVAITGQPNYGSLQVNSATGAIIYTPALNFFGSDIFRYRVTDNSGSLSNIAAVLVTVNPVNDRPVAANDTYAVLEDITRTVTTDKGLLVNDNDVDGDSLTTLLLASPTHGVLTLRADGSFSYTPAANFFGHDSFLYAASDGIDQSTPATVSLTIQSVNDVPSLTPLSDLVMPEGGVLARSGSFSDADPGDAWSATVDYGDGSGVQPLALAGTTFALNHAYADSGEYLTTVWVVDRAGAMGSATFHVTLQNLAPSVDAGTDQAVSEGALVTLTATFQDPGVNDTHTAVIDWGDGTEPLSVSVTETAGAGMLSANHAYADDGIYLVSVIVTDDEGVAASDTVSITAGNLPPVVDAGTDQVAGEGAVVRLTVHFSDPGLADTHTSIIDWGDGTNPENTPVTEAAGTGISSASHIYVDNGVYTVTVTVTDDERASASGTLIVTVDNVVPQIDGGPDRTVNEGDLVRFPSLFASDVFDAALGALTVTRFTGSFLDPGALDTHTASIDWGDGTAAAAPVVEQSFGVPSPRAGRNGAVLANHPYGDNGVYTVAIRVTDNDGGQGTDHLTIIVLNVAPTVDAGADRQIGVGNVFHLTADFSDPGVLDSHTAVIDWGDGTLDPAVVDSAVSGGLLVGTAAGSHVYTHGGHFIARVIVADDDGGSSSDSLLVSVDVGPDLDAPTSTVSLLPSITDTPFLVSWFGSDGAGGSGIASFDVFVTDNGGSFTVWQANTTETSHSYVGIPGHTYAFYSIARDNAGNVELPPSIADTQTTVLQPPPIETILSIAATSADKSEGNSGLTPFTFTVTRGGDTSGTTHVDFAVSGVGPQAADAADFGGLLPGGQITFNAGESSQTITILVRGDATIEPNETFRVTLSSATGGAKITSDSDTGTIRNDDVMAGFSLDCSPLHVGLNTCTILGATPRGVVDLALGEQSGNRFLPQFGVTLGILDPTIVAQGIVQPDGRAVVQVQISSAELLERLLLQAFEQAPTPRTTNIVIVGTPLLAAGGQGLGSATLSSSAFSSMLSALRNEAIARWTATGLSLAETNLLRRSSIEVADLASGMLGQTIDGRIFIDFTAAGHGWFVDASPSNDKEFQQIVSAMERIATSGEATGHIDLLTVLIHELGHVLGRTDLPAGHASALMTATLPVATRRQADLNPLDVNRDGTISPIDALLVINQLNSSGSSRLEGISGATSYLDVNLDGFISPIDALMIINALNLPVMVDGEGESVALQVESPAAANIYQAALPLSTGNAPSASMAFDRRATSYAQHVPRDQDELLSELWLATGVAAAEMESDLAASLYEETLGTLTPDDLLLDLAVDACDQLGRETPADHWFRHLGL